MMELWAILSNVISWPHEANQMPSVEFNVAFQLHSFYTSCRTVKMYPYTRNFKQLILILFNMYY